MILWKESIGNLKYYLAKLPANLYYNTTAPVASLPEAKVETALRASVWLQQQAVFHCIWNSIKAIEDQIAQKLKEGTGVLIIARVSESAVTNPDVQVPQRIFRFLWIESAGNSYETLAKKFESRDRISPLEKGWKNSFYHIWASRE